MIKIDKDEAMALRKAMPEVHIAMVNRQSSHKKYFAPEDPPVVRFIEQYRESRTHAKGTE